MTDSQNRNDEDPLRSLNPTDQIDPAEGSRPTDKPGPVGRTPAEKPPAHDEQGKATIEEFGEEGMGVGAKE